MEIERVMERNKERYGQLKKAQRKTVKEVEIEMET